MTERDAVAEVFRLPELVSLIVQHRLEPFRNGDRKQYWHLACVARSWLDPVMSIAWRRADLHILFAAKIDPGRRQYYADRIRHLRVNFPESMDEQLPVLSFRKLQSVKITQLRDDTEQDTLPSAELWIHSLLGPTLRSLGLWPEEIVPDNLPAFLANLCPGLESLQISLRENGPSSVLMLTDIVDALPRLRNLELFSQLHSSAADETERMLSSLVALSNLESLKFTGIVPDLPQICSRFPRLRLLRATASQPNLHRIGPLMPQLVDLDLELPFRYVAEPPTMVIAPLGSLVNLEVLTLRLQGDAPIESTDLETLAKFPNLTRLYIGNGAYYRCKAPAPSITDETLCTIFQHLPSIESLELRLQHPRDPSGGQALLTLAKHCRKLRTIYLPGHYDLATLLTLPQQATFADLGVICTASLFFKHARPDHQISRTEYKMMFDMLAQHCPKLSHIRFDDPHCHGDVHLNAALRKGSDAQCTCDQYGEPGEEHKHLDHMMKDDEENERPRTPFQQQSPDMVH